MEGDADFCGPRPLSHWSTRPQMNRKKGDGALSTHSLAPLESAHIKIHTHIHTKSTHEAWNCTNGRPRVTSSARREHTEGHATHSPPDLKTRRSHTHLSTQCGILLPVFRALVFGLALGIGESINLTWLDLCQVNFRCRDRKIESWGFFTCREDTNHSWLSPVFTNIALENICLKHDSKTFRIAF